MSKLLAMMMKPKNYMYATIKGSLTENNGVFSGFSSSNYLELQQQFDLNKDFEICINFTTSNDVTDPQLLLGYVLSGTEARLQIRFFSSTGSIQITNSSLGGGISIPIRLSENTNYKVIWKKENNVGSLSLYDSNNNLLGSNSTEYTNIETSSLVNLFLGVRASSSHASAFSGSIDLNQSYIKINSTKYQLQAVVGYTVVGSPTIVDGVVSGFSSANYINILNFPNTFNSMDIVIKAKKSATGNQPIFALQNGYAIDNRFSLYLTNAYIYFNYKSSLTNNSTNISIPYTAEIDTYCFYRVKVFSSKIILSYSLDGINWVEKEVTDTMSIASSEDFRFGIRANSSWYLSGSIDLNETYIKINNKLWFNGQPAE